MDKTQPAQNRVKHRQGFALLITLSVLAVIIALTTVLLSYLDEVKQDASDTKALIQADIYYKNITNIFQGFKNKKPLFSVLYSTALPLQTPEERFSLQLHCDPLYKGVNINWLGLGSSGKNAAYSSVAQELFEAIAQEYTIQDPGRLQEMLLEEIGGKNRWVQKEQSRLHQKNGIISYRQFSDIISRYQFEVDDPEIGAVPWKKYFSFSPEADKIDAQYSSPELLAYLFDMDVSTVQEWTSLVERGTLENFIRENGGEYEKRKSILAGETFLEAAECSVRYAMADDQYGFKFEYIQGEAKYFEFYGKQ
ncbi:hypothetical protein MN086_00130 [Sulfurovum sp. XGS-02]|uniref:hypothetical protein n=1 Tax=Sulfurovum sp. XGS-02 TaxID=2925411 RepID=UPI00205EE8BE|nr:hypothetical protein [Sulfurovum sp. XGS-02]UPT77579.1 hypothetical protein MN086_00130 [Sulfurovum sp. XGS-02]